MFFCTESSSLYQELLQLPFPPSLDDETRFRLLNTKTSNNKYALVEKRASGKSVALRPTTVTKYKSWLVIGDDGGVCKICKLFINLSKIPNRVGKFLSRPWTSYHRKQDLGEHEQTEYHCDAVISACNFKSTVVEGTQLSITHQLDKSLNKDFQMKKERLNSIIRALVFCGRQSIALRGHSNENLPLPQVGDYKDDVIVGDSVNRGNFIQVLELRRQSGDVRVDKFVNKKAMYTSPAIQNELLQLVSCQLTEKVVETVAKSPYYSIIADETRDVSNTEQLCIALRYYNHSAKQSDEKFLKFVPLTTLKGQYNTVS